MRGARVCKPRVKDSDPCSFSSTCSERDRASESEWAQQCCCFQRSNTRKVDQSRTDREPQEPDTATAIHSLSLKLSPCIHHNHTSTFQLLEVVRVSCC